MQTCETGSQTATILSGLGWRAAPHVAACLLPFTENAAEDCKHEEGSPREGRRDVHHAAPGALLSPALRPPG